MSFSIKYVSATEAVAHIPLVESARIELAKAIEKAPVYKPICPIYQNVDALPHTAPVKIKANLLKQLTSPVR